MSPSRTSCGCTAALVRAIFAAVREHCGQILQRRAHRPAGLRGNPAGLLPPGPPDPRVDNSARRKVSHGDLDTEGERLIGEWAARELAAPLLFVTGYAVDKRPVYTMPSSEDPSLTRSFDLLYKGIEITTGGQRIHRYDQLIESIRQAGSEPRRRSKATWSASATECRRTAEWAWAWSG